MHTSGTNPPRIFFETALGQMILGDCIDVLRNMDEGSVDLIMTSPPFALIKKKEYGNVHANEYLEWFKPFAREFHRVLKDSGSLVIDIRGVWNNKLPTRNLYHFKLPIMLCEELGFHLAQEMYWWNPAKMPCGYWENVPRVRVKDAVNTIWWLSKTPWPKASNRRVVHPYREKTIERLKKGRKEKKYPSGHVVSKHLSKDNKASIPSNLIALANAESNNHYYLYCKENGLKQHPARYPTQLPEFFIRMLTDRGDLVLDPFAGSCVTGEAAERTKRRWICCELIQEYLAAAKGRFIVQPTKTSSKIGNNYYQVPKPGILWNDAEEEPLPYDGGKNGRGCRI